MQAHGIVKRGRSNRQFTKLEPGAGGKAETASGSDDSHSSKEIQNGDSGHFLLNVFFLHSMNDHHPLAHKIKRISYIRRVQRSILAGVAVETIGTVAPDTAGDDTGLIVEYIEEEMEEEELTDDENVEVSAHDQSRFVLEAVAKPTAPNVLLKSEEPREPQTPEDCKKEFNKGTFQDWSFIFGNSILRCWCLTFQILGTSDLCY